MPQNARNSAVYARKFNSKIRHEVEQIIRQQQWSPEQIVGRFRLEGIPIVGKTTLYTFLHKDKENEVGISIAIRGTI